MAGVMRMRLAFCTHYDISNGLPMYLVKCRNINEVVVGKMVTAWLSRQRHYSSG